MERKRNGERPDLPDGRKRPKKGVFMRRKEREITDFSEIEAFLASQKIMRVGFCDEGHVYIVPVNFGFESKDGKFVFYFHGARDGRKFSLIQKGGNVGFEIDADYGTKSAEKACDCTEYYASVIGEGKIFEIEENDGKKYALNRIMLSSTGKDGWNFPSVMLSRVGVFRIEAASLSCKMHKKLPVEK